MSDPTRDVLTAHQSDINRAVDHRRFLLEQLYAATLSFLEFKAPGLQHNDLASFLDVNDISKGRSFDLSTLPGSEILGYGNQTLSDTLQPTRRSQVRLDESRIRQETSQLSSNDAHNRTSVSRTGEETPVRGTRSSARLPKDQASADQHAQAAQDSVGGNKRLLGEESIKKQDSLARGLGHGLGDLSEEQGLLIDREHGTAAPAPSTGLSSGNHDAREQRSAANEEARLAREIDPVNAETESTTETNTLPLHEQGPAAQNVQQDKARKNPGEVRTASSGLIEPPKSSPDLPSQYLHGSLDAENPITQVADFQPPEDVDHSLPTSRRGDDESLMRPMPGFRDHIVKGINGESSKDLTFSRRPPMQIDTQVPSDLRSDKVASGSRTAPVNATSSQTATPIKQTLQSASAQSPPERMTTRTTSGALRHKSVSEIMGEMPKISPSQADKANGESNQDESAIVQTPHSAASFASPDTAAFKLRLKEIKEKEKSSKLSTVVFAKPQAPGAPRPQESAQIQQVDMKEKPIKDRDYLLTLLVNQIYNPSQRADRQPLAALIKSAHKTLNTDDLYTEFRERQDTRILSKIHWLQDHNKWSLRQPERSLEPERPVAHWDVLLSQVKWMRTDFREEGKWKKAAAKLLAEACASWVGAPIETRKSLQVKTRSLEVNAKPTSNADSPSSPTPDLVHSAEDDASEVMDMEYPHPQGDPPAAIFSLPPDMFVFGLHKSPVSDKILEELPLYQPNAEVQDGALHIKDFSPDASWKTPIVPVSKYVQGKIIRREGEPPQKRSKLQYLDDDADDHHEAVLERENEDVALFNPEHKHIRDRIHTGHAFRPPTEHIMPSQAFFENRSASQWTVAEDDELRRLVREYAYNWSLISNCLSSPSSFSSGAERRTPWECFERWVTLEGLPAEMSKVNYFRAYHARLQAAAARTQEMHQLMLQQHPNSAQLPRRRSTQPFTVDRRKNNKHIHLIDAMRKLAKKRETKLMKDQHTASTAALRKMNEPKQARQQMHTPREFSRIKYERQLQREEQMKTQRIQMLQQQKAFAAARAGQQSAAQMAGAQHRALAAGMANSNSPNMTSAIPQGRGGGTSGDQARSGPPMQRVVNGQPNGVVANGPQGAPHAPMSSQQQMQQMSMGQRMPMPVGSDSMRVYQEASRVQAEQQAHLLRQRLLHQHPQYNGQNGSLNSMGPSTPNMLSSAEGRASPANNGSQQRPGSSDSQRPGQPQTLSSGITPAVNQIQNQLKLRNPQASPEQISRATTEQLYRMSQIAAQQAAQAAAGNTVAAGAMANGTGAIMNAQAQYARMLQEQQRIQQRGAGGNGAGGVGGGAGSGAGSPNMNGNRGAAKPIPPRTGSAQSGRGMSQSPKAGQVGVGSGQ